MFRRTARGTNANIQSTRTYVSTLRFGSAREEEIVNIIRDGMDEQVQINLDVQDKQRTVMKQEQVTGPELV